LLRQVITLADDAGTLSDTERRDRLLALADRARLAQRPLAMTTDQSQRLALASDLARAGLWGPLKLKIMDAFRIMNAFPGIDRRATLASGARGMLTTSTHARNPLGGEYG